MIVQMKHHKHEVVELATKGNKHFSIDTLKEAFDNLAEKFWFDTNKGTLYSGNVWIEKYSQQKDYNKQEAFDIALDCFKRWTRNEASIIIRNKTF